MSRTAGVRAKEMPGAERKLQSNNKYPITVQPTRAGIAWHMAEALDNLVPVPYLLSFFPGQVIAVLWPSGYGVTFRLCPIRDGKPREFESRQCQLFYSFISLVSYLPQPTNHTFQPQNVL